MRVLFALLIVGALVICWAMLLRSQVSRQTQVIGSHLREAEPLREAAESANRVKTQFLANMSHEMRTPLNGIIGMTELALDEPLTRNVREYLEVARSCCTTLLQVIGDVLDISSGEIGLESELGRGSTFWFSLPLTLATTEQPPLDAIISSPPNKSI